MEKKHVLFFLRVVFYSFCSGIMPPQKHRKNNLPDPLQEGIILMDTQKRNWRLGSMIAYGGFGLVYLGKISSMKYFVWENLQLGIIPQ